MPILIAKRRSPRFKISEYEFQITKLILDSLDIEFEEGYQLSRGYMPIIISGQIMHYAEQYSLLSEIPKDLTIFRPLRNDKHASYLIDMFEELDIIDIDNLTILEYENKYGKKVYKGYFVHNGKKIGKSYTYNAPNTATLKVFILAKYLLDEYDYDIFMSNLKCLMNINNRGNHHV